MIRRGEVEIYLKNANTVMDGVGSSGRRKSYL